MNNEIEYNLADVIRLGVRESTVQMYVSLPATVTSYDPEEQTISAKISINRVILDETIEYPVLNDVPLVLPRSNTGGFSFLINEGDEVMLHFIQRSTGNWRSKGPGFAPDSADLFQINDAVAYPCVFPQPPEYTARSGTEVIGEKVFVGNPDAAPVALTNLSGTGTNVESDLIQILSGLMTCFTEQNIISTPTGPAQLQPTVYADIKSLKAQLDAMILDS